MDETCADNTAVLAGDIGGTKTRIGWFRRGEDRPEPLAIQTYASREAEGIEEILADFIERHRFSGQRACFGIAGPVRNGACRPTHLPWEVSAARMRQRFGWQNVSLINDLEATALAVPLLKDDERRGLNPASIQVRSTMGVIAPGTGLGQAILVPDRDRWIPVSTEGGHADFAPANEEQVDLWRYLRSRHGHVSLERVLSGPGLVNIYAWLKNLRGISEPPWLVRALLENDPARVISCAALEERHEPCVRALNAFVSIFGSAAGNLALTAGATGGVYLGGGIAPRILPALQQGLFMEAFFAKGRFKNYLETIPVYVILNDQAALLGAAACAFRADEPV